MELLVLGGTLFVGRHLVDAALAAGHHVTLFNRGQTNPGLFPEARQLVGDRRAGELDALRGGTWDAVVDVNAYIPRHVREIGDALAGHAGHYTFVSTGSVYAGPPFPVLDETAPVATLDDPTVEEVTNETYGPLKALCEQAAEAAFPGHTTVVRPGIVAGPYDPSDRFTHWVTAMAGEGEVPCPARPEQPVQIIDGRDLGRFLLDVSTGGISGTFNAVGPARPLTFEAMLDACRAATGGGAKVAWGADGDAPLGLPDDGSYDGLFQVSWERAAGAGLRHRPVEETAADTLAWARRAGPPA